MHAMSAQKKGEGWKVSTLFSLVQRVFLTVFGGLDPQPKWRLSMLQLEPATESNGVVQILLLVDLCGIAGYLMLSGLLRMRRAHGQGKHLS